MQKTTQHLILSMLVSIIVTLLAMLLTPTEPTTINNKIMNKGSTQNLEWSKKHHNIRDHPQYRHPGTHLVRVGVPITQEHSEDDTNLPVVFNKWLEEGYLFPVQDQKMCGSCWAFAATEVLADRIRINTNKKFTFQLSPQYLVSCYSTKYIPNLKDHIGEQTAWLNGCVGGIPLLAMHLLSIYGAPVKKIVPYQQNIQSVGNTCDNGGDTCPCGPIPTGNCFFTAQQKPYNLCHNDGLHHDSWDQISSETIRNNVIRMKKEIMKNGPIVATMQVYEDFYDYQPHYVYEHNPNSKMVGGHAVVIVGWQDVHEQNDIPHWIVKNSYSDSFGMNGYFYIKMGTNESQIESNCSSCKVDMTNPCVQQIT